MCFILVSYHLILIIKCLLSQRAQNIRALMHTEFSYMVSGKYLTWIMVCGQCVFMSCTAFMEISESGKEKDNVIGHNDASSDVFYYRSHESCLS